MPYIPEKHKKYNLLPFCRKNGYEVFEYPSELLFEIGDINMKLCQTITPYGYKSYKEYYSTLDRLIKRNRRNKKLSRLLRLFKKEMIRLNNKDLWSVLKYTGETNEFHLTHGRAYYWPCTKEEPYFRGIVDDEEFTNYLYDVYGSHSHDWIILDDPTERAYRTLNNNRLTENELIKSVAQNLSEKQKMLICEEMDIPYDEVLDQPVDRWYEIYEKICDIECNELPDGDEPLTERVETATEIVTLLGNVLSPWFHGISEEDIVDEE